MSKAHPLEEHPMSLSLIVIMIKKAISKEKLTPSKQAVSSTK
jgi:hypothetical protein